MSEKTELRAAGGSSTGGPPSIIEAAAAEDRSKARLSGYLRKKSRADRWQKRWFEAVGHYLTYYKTHDSDKLLACIDLRQVGEIKMVPDGIVGASAAEFSVQLGDRTYFLKAKLRSDAQRWVEGLREIQELVKVSEAAAGAGGAAGGAEAVSATGVTVEMVSSTGGGGGGTAREGAAEGGALEKSQRGGCCPCF